MADWDGNGILIQTVSWEYDVLYRQIRTTVSGYTRGQNFSSGKTEGACVVSRTERCRWTVRKGPRGG